MTKQSFRLAGWASALLTLASTASADVKLNENFSVSGYISGSVSHTEWEDSTGASTDDSFMDVDAVKLTSMATFEKVSGTVSLHTFTSQDPVVLDAFATYTLDGGSSVTFGKFLSYLGFEAFDYPNMLQISYANSLGAFIPAYHSGVRYDFSGEGFSGGVAVLDSVYGATYYKGDGDLDNGAGFEGYLKYTKGDSSIFAGVAVDGGVAGGYDDQFTFDLWGQTKVGNVTLAAEYCYSKLDAAGGGDADGYFWLLLAMAPINDKWTITGRISGGEDETLATGSGTPSFFKATISPAVTLTPNLGILFEYSHIKYDDFAVDSSSFIGAQVIFKF
ncbi:MAG TPA: outer membrane beta-barrel protein [Lacunisphaera sp.]|nr:outer membrane beta-barrel protein [Lacunisphaera sp.]